MTVLGEGSGTSYPAGIDTALVYQDDPDPIPDSDMRVDAALVNDILSAVKAIENELGVSPKGAAASVAARFTALESLDYLTQAEADLLYAAAGHNHNGVYSPVGHNHDSVYAPLSHTHAISDITNLATTIAGLVPYSGATGAVDLGVYDLTARGVALGSAFLAMREPSGFENRTDSTLSATGRQVSLTGTYNVWIAGVKYTKTGGQSVTVSDTSAAHYVYFDASGNLVSSTSIPDLTSLPLVAILYWNAVLQSGRLADERHGLQMDGSTHKYLHNVFGARYHTGLAGTFGNTSLTIGAGSIYDEDLEHDISQQTQCRVFRRSAGAYVWTAKQNAWYTTQNGNVCWDNNGTLTEAGQNDYVAYWVFATNDPETPIMVLMGQRTDGTLAAARANNTYESLSFLTLPYAELKILYRLLVRNTSPSPSYIEATDYRSAQGLPSGTYVATAHSALTGLDQDDHLQYLTTARADLLYSALAHTHAWSAITDKPSTFAPTAHSLVGNDHTASGLTGGHFLKALTETTFGFAAHGLTYADVGAAASGHDHSGTYEPVLGNPVTDDSFLISTAAGVRSWSAKIIKYGLIGPNFNFISPIDTGAGFFTGIEPVWPASAFVETISDAASSMHAWRGTIFSETAAPTKKNMIIMRSRGTPSVPGQLSEGDHAGSILFQGMTFTASYQVAQVAQIRAQVDAGTITKGRMPGRLIFSTTAVGGTSPTDRLYINSTGELQFAQISAPATTTDRLWNTSGTLYWGGTAISLATHDHTGVYSPVGHDHAGVYEPALGNPASDGYVLSSTAAGVRSWVAQAGSPAGSDTYVQFNDGGVFGGTSNFTHNKTTGHTAIGGMLGVNGATLGSKVLAVKGTLDAYDAHNTVRIQAYSPAFELLDASGVQSWYIGINDAQDDALYIGQGVGAGAGVIPVLSINRQGKAFFVGDYFDSNYAKFTVHSTNNDWVAWFRRTADNQPVNSEALIRFEHYSGLIVPMPIFTGIGNRGNYGSPAAVQLDDYLLIVDGRGYDGAQESDTAVQVAFSAAGNWTSVSHPTRMRFLTTPSGATIPVIRTTIDEAGVLSHTGSYLKVAGGAGNSGVFVTGSIPSLTLASASVMDNDAGTMRLIARGPNNSTGGAIAFIQCNSDATGWSERLRINASGELQLAQISAPTPTTDRLYNVGGTLTWNGSAISLASHSHTGTYEPALGNPAADGYVLSSTAAGVRSWVAGASGGWTRNATYNFLAPSTEADRVAIGYTPTAAPGSIFNVISDLTGLDAVPVVSIHRWTDTAAVSTPTIRIIRGRGSIYSQADAANSDLVGSISFQYRATAIQNGAEIRAYVDGTPGNNDKPTRLAFYTCPDGSATLAERMRITSEGLIGLPNYAANNYLTIGSGLTFAPASGIASLLGLYGTVTAVQDQNVHIARITPTALTTAASGTHALLTGLIISPPGTETSSGAAVTLTSTVYINGEWSLGTNNYGLYVASAKSVLDGPTFINDTVSTEIGPAGGLVINMGADDNGVIVYKSSDVNHGYTAFCETDTFALIGKAAAANGGLITMAVCEDAAVTSTMAFYTYGGTANTTKTSAGVGLIDFYAAEHDGAGNLANITADGNVFSIRARVGAADPTLLLLDEDGELFLSSGTARIFVNDSTDANLTYGLCLNQGSADDFIVSMKSSDVAHGITTLVETDTFGWFRKVGANDGGLYVLGATEQEIGVRIGGFVTVEDTGKSTSANGAVQIDGHLKSGTTVGALATANTNILAITNNGTARFLFDIEGDAHADVQWTTFDEHDDLSLLDSLEAVMTKRPDFLKQQFGGWLDANKKRIQELRIANFYDDGPRAMLNTTRLSMLLTGAIRQLADRCIALEQQLKALSA